MLTRLNSIIAYGILAFFVAFIIYPWFIKFLKHIKVGQKIRSMGTSGSKASIYSKMHNHKAGTPSMGGALFLVVTAIMVLISIGLSYFDVINYSLFHRRETYIALFAFFSMGGIGLIDDWLNTHGVGKQKGLTAKTKLVGMFLFSAFISYWFYSRLGVDWINIWPLNIFVNNIFEFFAIDFTLPIRISLGIFYPLFTFVFTVAIVNAINIADGLDGLCGGLSGMVLASLGILTFINGWYLTTTVVMVVVGVLLGFLRYNINPAKIFMGDSGSLAIGGLIASLIYLINMRSGVFVPFMVLFFLFWVELFSSAIQIFWKRVFDKKFFKIAPYHHLLEYEGRPEHNIVMKMWVVQSVVSAIFLIMILYQLV